MPQHETSVEVPMAGGVVTSSKIPALHLIPTEALTRTAARFELGIERKGEEKAWNACSSNQACLADRKFVMDRIGHVMLHAASLRDKILRGEPLAGDDDAAAIAWSGAFLCCATKALHEQRDTKRSA